MSARGRFTCCDVMLCVLRSMFGLALCVTTLAPSAAETQENPGLAYVVSPPPATRGLMPNYLPKLPPETTATVPQVATHGARRLRTGCRSCQPRPRHIRRYRHTRHRTHHRRGHIEQRRWHLPRHRNRHAPRRWRAASGSPTQCCIASHLRVSYSDWNCDTLPYRHGCRCATLNHASINQQVAIIDLRKSQLSPTSAALMCHFISASSRTRGDADWRLGGTWSGSQASFAVV